MKLDPNSPPQGSVRDWLDFRAEHSGDKVAYTFPRGDEPLSWSELRDGARDIAARLTGLGVAKGDSVAHMIPNSRDGVLCLFGALYGGFRVTMINLIAGAEAMGYALQHSAARYALVGPDQRVLFDEASAALPNEATPIAVSNGVEWPSGADTAALHDLTGSDDALLMYTSGTTGRPKGVVHTHSSILAGGWTTAVAHELTEADRAQCVLPMCHINGLCVTIMAPFVSGGSAAVCHRFSASMFWDTCAKHEVTWFSVVPTIISHLLHGERDPDEDTKRRVRFGRSASSALAPDVQTSFEERFGMPIVETMGLTETAAQILSNPLPPGTRKIGSPGMAYGNEVLIMDSDLNTLPADTEGEIVVRGPNVMKCYLDNPEATAESLTEQGWLRTGDLGKIDSDGYVFVTGRLKELIIKGGENIAPREVDEALYSHPDVVEAAAFPRPCKTYGERVEAAVRLSDASSLTEEDLIAICHERLGKFKSPDTVYILDDLPKGPSGKILRREVAEMTA